MRYLMVVNEYANDSRLSGLEISAAKRSFVGATVENQK